MSRPLNRTVSAFLAAILLVCPGTYALRADEAGVQFEYFEQHVRPLLNERCLECHSADSDDIGGNLHLDSRAGWKQGGDLGSPIIPGAPEQSLLIQAVRHAHEELQMPPDEALSEQEIRILERWIEAGAADPRDGVTMAADEIDIALGRQHWAFRSPHTAPVPVPGVRDTHWPENEIDRFVLSLLERKGLQPVERADKRTLIRRVTLDLTGLPPTPSEISQFLADGSPDAYERLVERLLASPDYGERWGRFWLDVARYADSNGLDENIAHGNAWRYRDYVIASLNRDKPYDQFVVEQLAGDLVPPADADAARHERTIATGFLSLGPKVLAEVDETKMEMDIIDEQVETVGRAFMGLTLGCARCHDHKFDPIRTEDYYSLAGIFKSTKTMEHFTKIARWNEVSIASRLRQREYDAHQDKIAALKRRIESLDDAGSERADGNPKLAAGTPRSELKESLVELESTAPELPMAMAVTDYAKPIDLRVHVRGSFLTKGELVGRGFPAVLRKDSAQALPIREDASGRLELARWLVDGRHPLTARVAVNRIWRWHFGSGLVPTTDNFGRLGEPPTNPPLLDWLAQQLVADDWSIKKMHRRILLSAAYRLASDHDTENAKLDPTNRFLWRANVRRLEAETIRDSILAVSGLLDPSIGGSMLHVKNREFLFDHTSKDQTKYDSTRRSIYLPVIRNHLYDAFQLFDFSDASVMNSDRTTTTVAPQALFLMNSDLIAQSAASLAQRICRHETDHAARIARGYALCFGRPPTDREIDRAVRYLEMFAQQEGPVDSHSRVSQKAWTVLSQTLLMSNEFIHLR